VGPLLISATVEASNFKFGTQNGFGSSLPKKTTFRTKIGGVWSRVASRKIWDPLLISATVEGSNFKFGTQLGFVTSLPKTTFWTKIDGGLGQGSSQTKFGTRYVFLQPLKLTTSNVVQKLGLGLA